MSAQFFIQGDWKYFHSDDYNFRFNLKSGRFERWGKTEDDDPLYSESGPEILDIEVTTSCKGSRNSEGKHILCPFCYKSNSPNGKNMSFETFKTILDKMPITLTQIAFGVDAQAESNPDLWKMMEYARSKSIIPNLTVADISDEVADKISTLAGACAVSRYEDKNACYNSVKKLVDRGMKQVNIHCMISKETFVRTTETFVDMKRDSRLQGMYAIVMLSLKQKGRGTNFTPLSQDKFNVLCAFAHSIGINFGFDSCGSSKYIKFLNNSKFSEEEKEELMQSVEPCESFGLFSSYINVDGLYYPCSFAEGQAGWENGFDVLKCDDFVKDFWAGEKFKSWRNKSLLCNRECLFYNV